MHDIHDTHDAAEATCLADECLKAIKPQDDSVEVPGGLVHLACFWQDDERNRAEDYDARYAYDGL